MTTKKEKIILELIKWEIDFWKGKYFLFREVALIEWYIILIIGAISFLKLIWRY